MWALTQANMYKSHRFWPTGNKHRIYVNHSAFARKKYARSHQNCSVLLWMLRVVTCKLSSNCHTWPISIYFVRAICARFRPYLMVLRASFVNHIKTDDFMLPNFTYFIDAHKQELPSKTKMEKKRNLLYWNMNTNTVYLDYIHWDSVIKQLRSMNKWMLDMLQQILLEIAHWRLAKHTHTIAVGALQSGPWIP